VTNLTAAEWLERWRGFRQRHPGHGRLEPVAALAQSWREADASEVARNWPAAIHHLDRLIAAHPTVGPLYARRGHAYAELEHWDKAAADYARASELRPEDGELGYRRPILCLARGDEEEYRRVCADVLQRFGEGASLRDALDAARVCTLRPDAVPEPAQLVRIAENAEKAAGVAPMVMYRTTRGIVLYRAGRFEEAIQRLNESIAARNGDGIFQEWLFLAMAHHRLGHAAEARQWLDKTIQWAEQKQADAEPLTWLQRVQLQLLRREAEGLIDGTLNEAGKYQ
jgi:tetratricopeptide (TPR) repeat protein